MKFRLSLIFCFVSSFECNYVQKNCMMSHQGDKKEKPTIEKYPNTKKNEIEEKEIIPDWNCKTCYTKNSVRINICKNCHSRKKVKIYNNVDIVDENQDTGWMNKEQLEKHTEKIAIKNALKQIKLGQEIITKYDVENKPKILTIGVTGAGKSTIINGITNKTLIFKEIKEKKEEYGMTFYDTKQVIDVEEKSNIKIGHDLKSETTVPNFVNYKEVNYMDCPGFEDSRGSIEEIVNSFFVNFLFKNNVKLLIIVPISMVKAKRHQKQLGDLIKKLRQIVGDILNYKDSIAIVVSKTTKDLDSVINSLKMSLGKYNRIKTRKEDQLEVEEIRMFAEIISKNRAHYFPTPTKLGRIGAKDFDIMKQILSDLEYKNVKKANIIVSSEALNYAGKLGIIMNDDISNTVSYLCAAIEDSLQIKNKTYIYYKYIKDIYDTLNKASSGKEINTTLNNDTSNTSGNDHKKDDEKDEKECDEGQITDQNQDEKNSVLNKFIEKTIKGCFLKKSSFFDTILQKEITRHCSAFIQKASFLKFLYKINPQEEKNLKKDKWINSFASSKEHIYNDFIFPLEQYFEESLSKILQEFIALFEGVVKHGKDLSSSVYESYNFDMYVNFHGSFQKLNECILNPLQHKSKNLKGSQEKLLIDNNNYSPEYDVYIQLGSSKPNLENILEYLEDFFKDAIQTKEDSFSIFTKKNNILNFSEALTSEGVISSFEKKLKERIDLTFKEIKNDFEIEKVRFLKSQYQNLIKSYRKALKQFISSFKKVKNLKESINIKSNFDKYKNDCDNQKGFSEEIINNLVPLLEEKTFDECTEQENCRKILSYINHVYNIDHYLVNYEDKTTKSLLSENIHKELLSILGEKYTDINICFENLLVEVEENFDEQTKTYIYLFMKELLNIANKNANNNKIIKTKLLKLAPIVENIESLDKINEKIIENFKEISECKSISQIFDLINSELKDHPNCENILKKDYWSKFFKVLIEGIDKCEATIQNNNLLECIESIKKKISKKLDYEVKHSKSLDTFIKNLDNIYNEVKIVRTLTKEDFLSEIADSLYKMIMKVDNNSEVKFVETDLLKKLLFELKSTNEIRASEDVKIRGLVGLDNHVREEREWYKTLKNNIIPTLSDPKVIYNDDEKCGFSYSNESVNQEVFKSILKLSGLNENSIEFDSKKIIQLENLISMFSPNFEKFSDDKNNKLIIKGINLRLSEVMKIRKNKNKIEIIALNSILIDENIYKGLNLLSLSIISPNWYLFNNHTIDLTGQEGASPAYNGGTGSNGNVGKTGISGGNFFGVIKNTKDYHKLTIKADGGKGGRGQNGGSGANGSSGSDASHYFHISYNYRPSGWFYATNFVGDSHSGQSSWYKDGKTYYSWYDCKNYGNSGTAGKDGGKGGRGGYGGLKGIVKIFDKHNNVLKNIVPKNGHNGEDGSGGSGGSGGRNGDDHASTFSYSNGFHYSNEISKGYASNGKTPTEKCGSPSSPVSLSEYYTKTVQSVKHKFNNEIDEARFKEKYKDFCRLLFFDELWDFNKKYVQLAELN